MKPILYVTGDATNPQGEGVKIIAHVCNDVGGWGRGFVVALSRRSPLPEAAYRAWHRDRDRNDFGLGAMQWVQITPDLWVANLVGQHGLGVARDGTPPVRYDAIEQALGTVGDEAAALQASVHLPRIGCGLAGGTWEAIEPLIVRQLSERDIPVTVYDLPAAPIRGGRR